MEIKNETRTFMTISISEYELCRCTSVSVIRGLEVIKVLNSFSDKRNKCKTCGTKWVVTLLVSEKDTKDMKL